MKKSQKSMVAAFFVVLFILFSALCPLQTHAGLLDWVSGNPGRKPDRTVSAYEEVGKDWGKQLKGAKPSDPLNEEFVSRLKDPADLDFFSINRDLKDAFRKGFTIGYEERSADLVLGSYLTAAAGQAGQETSGRLVKAVNDFEAGWANTLKYGVEVFRVLILEGSTADRQIFITNFTRAYNEKYENTQVLLKALTVAPRMSETATPHLDFSKGKTAGVINIPGPHALKIELYHQTFGVIGDEWGRRLSVNLIRRDELIDLLRRCKPSLAEIEGNNLGIIYDSFVKSYGLDAESVFRELVKDAGFKEVPLSYSVSPDTVKPHPLSKPKGTRRRK